MPNDEQIATVRSLCTNDLFFLLVYGLNRPDADNDFVFARCREVQASPNGHLDLWAREHFKSSIITFAATIQDILKDPEVTVGFFSHTRPIAKAFLRQIKQEFEHNHRLVSWFPDVLWEKPKAQAPKWSEDEGIVVRRKGNPKESTVEAWGLVDSQPTSKHFKLRVYDDVVTQDSVTTPEQIAKTVGAWELSLNLGTRDGVERYVGTRYHANDPYREIISRGTAAPRIYPATADGKIDGEPVLMSRQQLAKKRRDQGPYTFACQMMQDPRADETQGFREEWLRTFQPPEKRPDWNIYILVDAASEKKKTSDYTAMIVVGLAPDNNYYVLDMVRDRLNLTERADTLFRLHKRWGGTVGYEKYGMMADVEHVLDRQARENYRFPIVELGGTMPKTDRIKRLIPIFEQGRWYLPESCHRTNYEGTVQDLTAIFVEEEFKTFPVPVHEDMFDAMARILDEKLGAAWPRITEKERSRRYQERPTRRRGSGWAA